MKKRKPRRIINITLTNQIGKAGTQGCIGQPPPAFKIAEIPIRIWKKWGQFLRQFGRGKNVAKNSFLRIRICDLGVIFVEKGSDFKCLSRSKMRGFQKAV